MSGQTGYLNSLKVQVRSFWHIPDDISKAVALPEYCQKFYYSRNAVLRQILKRQIVGFKIGHRWYVIPPLSTEHSK